MLKYMGKKGFVFVFSLLFLVLVSILGIVFTNLISTDTKQVLKQEKNQNALYLAESGVYKAIKELIDTCGTYTGETDTSLGDGTYSVVVSSLGSYNFKIESTGYIPNSTISDYSEKIEVLYYLGGYTQHKVFTYAAFANDILSMVFAGKTDSFGTSGNGHVMSNNIIDLKISSRINGDAYAVNSISLGNSSVLDGDAYSPSISVKSGSSITGTEYTGSVSSVTFPTLNMTYYENLAKNGGTHTGDLDFLSGENTLGPKYITGDLTIKNSAKITLTGPVYVVGNVEVKNTGRLEGSEILCTEGDVLIRNSSRVGTQDILVGIVSSSSSSPVVEIDNSFYSVNAVFFTPNGKIELKNIASSNVSLVGENVTIRLGTTANYIIPRFLNLPGATPIPSKVISWQEE